MYYPSCSTEPWQLEGVLKTLLDDKYKGIYPVENKTVVTNPWKGAKLNKWLPILEKYKQKFTALPEVEWVQYKPKHEMLAMDKIFPEGNKIPKMFLGKNVIHFPTVKCVHPDTEIFLDDGTIIPIKELVTNVQEKKEIHMQENDLVSYATQEIPTLSESGKLVTEIATSFWKTPSPEFIYQINTRTGRKVKVSEVHPFLTQTGWKSAKELREEERIAIPRKIYVKSTSQELPKIKTCSSHSINAAKINFKNGKKHSAKLQKKIVLQYTSGKTTTQLAKKYTLHVETIRGILLRYNIPIRWVKKQFSVPEKTSSSFWKWLGYFAAEGYANECNGTMRFWFGNGNKVINEEYANLTKEIFNITPKIKKAQGKIDQYYFDCKGLIPFFEELNFSFPILAGNKTIPRIIFKCPPQEISAFIQSYLDGDGTVGKDGLHATSKSKLFIERLQLLFSRLGIISSIRPTFNYATNGKMKEKQEYWRITVSGDDLTVLSSFLKFHSQNKQSMMNYLVERRENSKQTTNWDTIPVNKFIFRTVREGLGFTQEGSGKPSSVNSIENEHSLPTRKIMNYFIELFESADEKHTFSDQIAYFKFLSSKDIAWDHIASVEKIKSDTPFLYDLSVSKTHSFIGNGIILHNTHGHTLMTGAMKNAFGGLITERRHHCHKMIHEVLVDLLQIQKEIHPGIFAVMDGTVCGDGAGPRTMIPKIKNYILASNDQVAIDAISAKMMGYDPLRIKFIKLAHDRGLGCGDPAQIDIVGEDITDVNFHFNTNKSPIVAGDQLFRKGALSFVEPLLFHTPLFKMCVFASEFYHDKLWYNTVGKKRINQFMKTEWGQLFQKYK